MDMSQYMSVFIDESREHLQLLNESLLEFEKDNENLSIVEVIFRSAHTLKGMAATMNFTRTAELTHHMENVLDLIRNNKLKSSATIVDTLFECLDTLTLLIDEVIEDGEETTDIEDLSNRLEKLTKGEPLEDSKAEKIEGQGSSLKSNKIEFNEFEKQLLDEAESKKMNAYVIEVVLDEGCLLKAARTYMVFRNLEEIGEIIKSEPSAQDLEEEKFDNSFEVVLLTDKKEEEVKGSILSISEISEVIITNVKDLEKEGNKEIKVNEKSSNSSKKAENSKSTKKEKKSANKKIVVKKTPTVRVDTDKLDKLMNLVAELVINKTRLSQIGLEYNLPDLSETLAHVDRVTSDLQAVVTKVRMVPIENVFNRFPRMIRDLSKDLNKEIELLIEGKETELDRTVIDEIGDPLVHLLRNSLDHGIELPEEREKSGKIRQGTILLKAEHEGNNVVITIADDGKGIDTKVIARKAIEKGLVKEEELELMSKEEILKFIFAAGFSTMEAVTELSGRGVGMDVVRNKIEGLNGQIELSSEVGEGTTTRIKLPLTLAIIEALLIKLQEEIYAIPLANIVETIDISPKDIKGVQNEDVIVLRGEVVPIINLNEVLDVPGYKKLDEETYIVVIVKIGSKKIGLIVDSLIGQQEIVIKSLGKLFTGIRGITGATVLGTGEVAIILDVLTLI
ncbi:chemotaxis protein CheA [Haliovirga abyssi]|uniref:Chemotaxis protein CheA n=1 Tax=Haliovirga abyssi TaxID=2996794 RepID=A0AAU9DJR6_9FUSO|nr:chemotaxis protein CheA [Haliovirga abyssi]BDU50127.1 chemotaxis protein CheA [Haliovirga abyssi]